MATGLLRRAEAAGCWPKWKLSTLARSELATKWKSDRLTRTTFRGVGCSGWKPHHSGSDPAARGWIAPPAGRTRKRKDPKGWASGPVAFASPTLAAKGAIVSLPSPFGAGKPNPSTSTTDPLIQALARLLAEGRLALRPRDAARAIGVSERTLWNLTNRGEGPPSVRLGSLTVYPVADLVAWLSHRAAEGVRGCPMPADAAQAGQGRSG
jgi:predicted DNA-binding transcriptional regulator AlpA